MNYINATHDTKALPADLERIARKRASAKMGWFIHATVYLCVNAFLALSAWQHSGHWHLFPLVGWGFGLLMHGVSVWLFKPFGSLHQNLLARERDALRSSTH